MNNKEYLRKWYKKNKKRVAAQNLAYQRKNPRKRRHYKLKHRYGISLEQYELMYRVQKGKCKICKEKHKNLNVDHCHKNGKIRGLLCGKCNKGLGIFKDSTLLLKKAIMYLKEKNGIQN